MLHTDRTPPDPPADAPARTRRVLFFVGVDTDDTLSAELPAAGFDARAVANADEAAHAVAEFAPHVVLVEVRGSARDERLDFARALRADEATRALPLVLLFRREDERLRAAALELGADDCFALSTPPREALARLEALFWRVEAGRSAAAAREASAARERRAEIDDFMQLLDAARARAASGETFAVALLAPAAHAAQEDAAARYEAESQTQSHAREPVEDQLTADARALKAAHEFLRVNLRRADSVAFYGPTLLAACLPRRRTRDAREDLARLLAELEEAHPTVRLVCGLASFPEDGSEVEILIERAEAALASALDEGRGEDEHSQPQHHGDEHFQVEADAPRRRASASPAAPQPRGPEQEFLPLNSSGAGASEEWRAPSAQHARASSAQAHAASDQSHPPSKRGLPPDFSSRRVVRESKRKDEFEAAVMPSYAASGGQTGGVLERAAAEAAERERERRAAGAAMPRRVLLTVSDPARMAQVNLLLRSAGYEVRAAFDGGQALDLLRIERADLLVLDYGLKVLDGLEVLRRLNERHGGQLPLPVVLLVPPQTDGEELRDEARRRGATGFVELPYDPTELLDCVRTAGSKD